MNQTESIQNIFTQCKGNPLNVIIFPEKGPGKMMTLEENSEYTAILKVDDKSDRTTYYITANITTKESPAKIIWNRNGEIVRQKLETSETYYDNGVRLISIKKKLRL